MLETVENNINQKDFKQMFLVNLKLEEARYKIKIKIIKSLLIRTKCKPHQIKK